jgi:hypothetical protein
MFGRPNPACPANGVLMKAKPPATPYPTAGSVMGIATGKKPYFSWRKPLTSSQPSSSERNFDGEFVFAEAFVSAGALVGASSAEAAVAKKDEATRSKRIVFMVTGDTGVRGGATSNAPEQLVSLVGKLRFMGGLCSDVVPCGGACLH